MSVRDTTIPPTMRAVRCHGIKDYRVETHPTPSPSSLESGELLVRVTRCGICAGDAKCYAGAAMFWGDATRPRYVQTPVTPGHEFCGVVAATRREGFQVGDPVTAEQVVACGDCLYCQKGLRWLCAPHDIFGFHTNVHGGLAEYMVFPAKARVFKFPGGLGTNDMVYTEPLSCAVHGVERGDIHHRDVVVVGGCGPVGLGMVAAAKACAPARLVAVDLQDRRLDLARECGADVVIHAGKEDVVKTIMEMTSRYGCDVYLEASGVGAGVVQGLRCLRKMGTMVEFSVFKEPTTVDWTVIGDTKELNIRGGHCSGDRGYEVAIDMLRRSVMPVDRIITHCEPIYNAVPAIGIVDRGTEGIKVTVDPTISA